MNMARLKITKGETGAFAALPDELASALKDGQEIEIFPLRDGIYIITIPGALSEKMPTAAPVQTKSEAAKPLPIRAAPAASLGISLERDEEAVARKLCKIRYENREVPKVEAMLNAAEKKALAGILQKKLITIGKNAKYPKGVYNISDALYNAMRTPGTAPAASARAPSVASPPINTVEHLQKLGYMILDNETEAKNLMPRLQDAIKADDVKGVRGFDKKYYVLLRGFYVENEAKIIALLDAGPKKCDAMAPEVHLTPEGVRTLLMVLADQGEVIEKAKGVWERA